LQLSNIQFNRIVMAVIFFLPLSVIAIHESHLNTKKSPMMRALFNTIEQPEDDIDETRDPACDEPEGNISNIPFEQLVSTFPNIAQVRHTLSCRSHVA
jgi:hypothetical protein